MNSIAARNRLPSRRRRASLSRMKPAQHDQPELDQRQHAVEIEREQRAELAADREVVERAARRRRRANGTIAWPEAREHLALRLAS